MRVESELLAAGLLKCHARIREAGITAQTVHQKHLIPYKLLCEESGVPHVTRIVGSFLGEIATWCYERKLPPINCLAINGAELKPGPGYDTADGCSEATWWKEVEACVTADYPPRIL
jgi:hypothetical protein